MNRHIVFTDINKAELLPCAMPKISSHQVLMQIEFSTISSGTVRANITGELNVSPFSNNKEAIFPRYGGYSSAGIVLKIGKDVTNVRAGDCVALSWSTHSRCIGIDSINIHKIEDDSVSPSEAVLQICKHIRMRHFNFCYKQGRILNENPALFNGGIFLTISVYLTFFITNASTTSIGFNSTVPFDTVTASCRRINPPISKSEVFNIGYTVFIFQNSFIPS